MKKLIILSVAILSILIAQTETVKDTTWQKELTTALSFSQAYFDNWAAGGENNIAGQLDVYGKLIHNTEKHIWTNTEKIAYGITQIGEDDAKKTIDEIKIESTVAFLTGMFADPYISAKAETQLTPGYAYNDSGKVQISNILDPGYFTQSAGLMYSPTEDLSARFGVAVKETITRDYPAPFADDPDTEELEKTKVEPGVEAVFAFNKKLNETTQINSSLDLFNNFKGLDVTDVKWDTDVTTKITEYINVKLSLKLFYDKDISDKLQLSQALMLGISYSIL